MADRMSTQYINSTVYTDLEDKIKELHNILDDLCSKQDASRKLRYAEVDIEAEREAGRFQPDELYVPQHIIDTNIRREQSPYVQYITQSPRAIICENLDDDTTDLSNLEKDLTKKLRYDRWQLSQFANIDAFQANGYSVMEIVQDQSTPGEIACESVQYGDFAFISDTRDIQSVEMTARNYYFTKTRLVQLCGDGTKESDWNRNQVDKLISQEPTTTQSVESSDQKDRSLYMVKKVMFRVNGTVNVAWAVPNTCDDWVRKPRPLFIGRKKVTQTATQPIGASMGVSIPNTNTGSPIPQSEDVFETNYPYVIFPYLISENDTINHLKGRIFLDQDLQEAVTSLISSTVTKARRSAGLYFSKDTNDPNDDILMQKNIFFRSGCLINSKVQSFELSAPDPAMFSSIQMLMTSNQAETSQVNFAVNNRKDSRKTAEEVKTASQQQQILSTVQVVLFSIGLSQVYRVMTAVIKSRVQAGLIVVNPLVRPLYDLNFTVKPSGDVDVIEKQQLIQKMMQAWQFVGQTPIAQVFMLDLLGLMFPERIAKYEKVFADAQQQANSQQQQMMQQGLQMAQAMGKGIVNLAKHPEFFSDTGRVHALPMIEMASEQIQQVQKQLTNGQTQ